MTQQRGDFSSNPRLILITLIAVFIGAISTFVAKGLLLLIALFTNLFYSGQFSFTPTKPSMEHWGLAFIFVPVIGGIIIGLMARFGSEKIRGHGIPEALEAILFGKSIMQPKVAILKPISSAISIGSGGPFGAEGPIIMTGGAVGSITAQLLHLTAAERKTLLVAGAAAGMSAIFGTPIAAILLSIELLLFELKPRSLVPVAVASIVAALVRTHLLEHGPLFPVAAHAALSEFALIGAVMLGLLTGAFSSLLSKTLYKLEDLFHKLPFHWMWWPAIGGVVIGIGGYFEPRALGVGYDVIGDFLTGNILSSAIWLILIVKVVIWIVALASGTSGGVLAPLLIFGAAIGALASPYLPGDATAATWALIGMGAVMAGMMRSPFTAVFFCYELTKDSEILFPLLIASVCSYAFTVLFMKRSILTEKIARRGFDIFREYGVDPLERMRVKEVMTTNPKTFLDSTSISQIEKEISNKSHHGYPVLNVSNGMTKLVGLIALSDLAKVSELEDIDSLTARDLIQKEPITITAESTCRTAANKMAEFEVGRILVVSATNANQLIGIITRSDLLKPIDLHSKEESQREKIFFSNPKGSI